MDAEANKTEAPALFRSEANVGRWHLPAGKALQVTWSNPREVRAVELALASEFPGIDTIKLESRSGIICVEMAKKFEEAGFRMVEIPVSHYPRMHGRSEFFRVRHLAYTFRGLLKIWWKMVVTRRLPFLVSAVTKKSQL